MSKIHYRLKPIFFYLVFAYLLISWSFYFHELAHLYTCELLGYDGTVSFDVTMIPSTVCPSVDESIISSYLFTMMPYLVGVIVFISLFWLLYIKKQKISDRIVRSMPYVIAIDIIGNYIAILFGASDFQIVFVLLNNYGLFSIIPVIMPVVIVFIGIMLLAWKDLKSKILRKDTNTHDS